MEIIIATHNRDKVREFHEILEAPILHFLSLADLGFDEEIPEDGTSYKANAQIKARTVHQQFGGFVLADDSGLSVDCLDGFPGIYSARFAGEKTNYKNKIERLWALMDEVPDEKKSRNAAFHCAICFIDPEGREYLYEREFKGLIADEMKGQNGFGYDPIFYLPEYGKTAAELLPEEKHRISHRGLALRDWFKDFQERYLL